MLINDSNYIVIQGWMRTRFDLKGNELLVFAIIFGFCQDGGSYHGSLQYIADFIGTSRQTVINTIKSLVDKKLIVKKAETHPNNVKFNTYQISLQVVKNFDKGSQNFLQGVVKKFDRGSQNFLPNNKDINNIDNKEDNILLSAYADDCAFDYQKIVSLFNQICVSLPKVEKLTANRKQRIKAANKDLNGDFEGFFRKIEASDFLTGRSGSWSGCSFDWIFKPQNLIKIVEGNYDNKCQSVNTGRGYHINYTIEG